MLFEGHNIVQRDTSLFDIIPSPKSRMWSFLVKRYCPMTLYFFMIDKIQSQSNFTELFIYSQKVGNKKNNRKFQFKTPISSLELGLVIIMRA